MNLLYNKRLAAEFGCTIDTTHQYGYTPDAEITVTCDACTEQIGTVTAVQAMSRQELITIFERVSGKSVVNWWQQQSKRQL